MNSGEIRLESAPFLRFIVAGKLQRNFILPVEGKPALDTPGGSLIFAASGLMVWDASIGLVSRVGEDYPQEWLDEFNQRGFDCRGIRVMPQAVDAQQQLIVELASQGLHVVALRSGAGYDSAVADAINAALQERGLACDRVAGIAAADARG